MTRMTSIGARGGPACGQPLEQGMPRGFLTTCIARASRLIRLALAVALGGAVVVALVPTGVVAQQCGSSGTLALGKTGRQSKSMPLTLDGLRTLLSLSRNGAKGVRLPEATSST